MGCAESRKHKNEHMALIQDCEKTLGYHDKDAKAIESSFKKYSQSGRLNDKQFTAALRFAKLTVYDADIPEQAEERQRFQNFYKSEAFFQRGHYDARRLVYAGILMSRGTRLDKANLLFDQLDVECEEQISMQALKTFQQIFHEINLSVLEFSKGKKLAEASTEVLNVDKIRQQWMEAKFKVDEAFTQLFESIQGTEVSRQQFVDALAGASAYDFTSTYGIREAFAQIENELLQEEAKKKEEEEQKKAEQEAAKE